MPGSNRGKRTASVGWVFPSIGLLIALFLSWGAGWLQAREEYNRHQKPAAYKAAAKDDAQRTCVGIDTGAVFECVNKKVETAYQTAHDEQDLGAQQRAATSALASAIISFVTLIVSMVGVWYVKRTLDATLQAVEDTSDATKAMREQNRIAKEAGQPVVILSLEEFKHITGKDGTELIVFSLVASNVGGAGCAVEGFGNAWGDAFDNPSIFTGMTNVLPLPSGAKGNVFTFSVAKQAITERPILRGYVWVAGPLLKDFRGSLRFSFHVFTELSYPNMIHYKRHNEPYWSNSRLTD